MEGCIFSEKNFYYFFSQISGDRFSKDFYRQDTKNNLLNAYVRFKLVTGI